MKRINLGQMVAILANIGVIGGLVFLGYELRQNTAQMRAEAAYSINESVELLNQAVFQDGEFAELLVRGEQSFDDLDPVDQRRLVAYFFSEINLADYIVGLEEEGLSDLHFRYVEFKIDQFRSSTGRRKFIERMALPNHCMQLPRRSSGTSGRREPRARGFRGRDRHSHALRINLSEVHAR